jgi:hypothetical protein
LSDPQLWMRSLHPADRERIDDRWRASIHVGAPLRRGVPSAPAGRSASLGPRHDEPDAR